MGERRRGESGEPGTGFPAESEESNSLLQRAVAVLQSSYLDSTSQDGFQYSQAILVENDLFLSELKAFARAKEAAGYSQEELQETFAFLLFDKEEEAKEVCETGLRVNSSSISTLGDPAKGVYISKYADCLHPRPWHHGKSGYIVICKLIKGKVRVIAENSTTTSTCPSPGYDCHVSNHGPTKSSPCQAFEQSQYYVYEVSGGSTAERPRQVCPYIFLACQYREPKDMPVLAVQNPAERNHKALYCPWRGQLSIRGQLLCTIALRTPYSSTIPAQLPPNLDINHVMGLSDLKKKLPGAAFGKRNYTGNEVCFQGVYSSLYEVEITNKDQQKMDQLVENLKEKDLAIIKYLRDQGVLILLTSSALAREDGLEPKEPVSLLALFLFTSPRALGPAAEKRDPKDGKEGRDRSDISLKIASVLPGLRYALRKAADSSRNSSWNSSGSTSTWIKEHLQEYAKLWENSQPTPGQNGDVPVPSPPLPSEDEAARPSQKLSERSLAQLQRYLSDPSSFTLGMSAALECLSGAGSNLGAHPRNSSSAVPPPDPAFPDKSEAPNPAPELEQTGERFPKNVGSSSKLWGQQNRRKSSRILGKNLSPLKTHPREDDSRNREAARKKINIASPFPKKSGSNSSEPMLKLANLQLPHGRKRGAEVLAAEIIHKPQREPEEKESSAPAGPALEAKRPKTLENLDVRKVPVAESGTKAGKNKTLKSLENRASKPPENKQAEKERTEPLSDLPSEASSQSHGAESQRNDVYPLGIPSVGFALRGDNCESHALNLLADLALGSCIPPFIPKDSGIIPVSPSLPSDSREPQSFSKPRFLRVASDHKYHRAEKHGKKTTSSSRVSPNQLLPENPHPSDLPSPPKEKTSGIFGMNSVNPSPAKLQVLPPWEVPEAAEVNKHSIISAEHSYASPMPEHPRKHPNPKGNPNPGPAPSRNGTRNAPAGPLVGKVLPFRHQQSGTLEPSRSRSIPRKKEDFAKSHTVNVCGNSMKVTCRWEEEYLFHLDSRYTNDSLEKTVIRALHGPWDPDLPDDVEGMKLILHMWVALFYRKPSKLLSSSRKVVEHSNPTKFVSINSSGGFLELSDDSQDCFGFETCPADSGSDPDQTPSSSLDPSTPSQGLSQPEKSPADSQTDADGAPGAVDSTVSSSSGELPCGEEEEPSSTSCAESLSLQDDARESLDVGDQEPEAVPEEGARGVSSIAAEEPVKENPLDSRITPSPSQELGCSSESPAEPGTENPGGQTPNSSSTPWTDPPCVPQENGEQQENQWEAGSGSGPGPPEDEEGLGDCGHPLEVEDGSWAAGADPQPACDSGPLEANPASAERGGGATEEGEESQEPSEHSGKEEREVKEEKENEEFEDESSFLGPVDLVLSESSDAEMECERGEQNPGNSASPEEFGVPEGDPVPSPTSLASPCPDGSTPAPSDGTGTDPGGFPEEMSPNQDELPDPWDAPATPDSETNGLGVASPAELGSPHSDSGEPLSPPDPSPVHGAQPDSVTGNPEGAGDVLENGLEQKNGDRAPSAERWEPAGSTAGLESPRGQGMALTLSPDSSSICLTSPDRSVDPWAAPEDPPVESLPSPSQSDLGRSSCFSQVGEDDVDPELNSLDTEESNQGGSGVLVEEQRGSVAADGTEELDDPMGAGDGRDSPLDYADVGDDSRAEEREDEFPEAENSPGNDTTSMETAADVEPDIPLHHHLLESEPSSSIQESISAIKELPRQQRNFPNIHRDSAPASPPRAGDSNPPIPAAPSRRESVLCRLWKPCQEGGAAQVSVAAWSPDGSLNPSCSQEVTEAPCSPADEFVPAEPGSAPPSPCDPWDDPEGAEPGSPLPEALPGVLAPSPDSARWSGSCGSPGSQAGDAGGSPGEEPIPPEDLEGGSIPSPAPFPARECLLYEPWAGCEHIPEGSEAFPDADCAGTEVGEGEIPASPIPASPSDEHRDPSGESPELSDAKDVSDELPREEQVPSQDGLEGSAFEDPLENSFGDSDQEYFEGNSHSPLPSRNSCIMSSMDAAGTRTSWDNSSRSSMHVEEHGEDWDRGIPRDYGSFVVTTQCQERMENFRLPKRRRRRARESPLLRSLMGTWRGFEEITQNTLDMECLRFHYKLKQILRNGKPPYSTSKSIFPKDFPAPIPLSPRSRSPLQVTIPPSDTWPGGLRSRRHRDHWDSGRVGSRDRGALFHLGKLRYNRAPPAPRGDVAVILDEYSEFQRVVLSRAEAGSEGPARGEAEKARIGMAPPGGTVAFRGTIAELRGALHSHLRRVADGQPGMFYLLETGQEPFFDRVKALLKDEGFVRTEPLKFCGAQRRDSERLLVIVRNEDISSHIHSVPCLLELKRCPGVVFAGVDDPEDVTGDTFQELFQAGGFVVSDEELLERVTLGQLKEVVKVLEKLNRNGRWKWLLHHRESKKLRGDLRDDANAQKKQLLLKWCQGEELVELLHFHGCDSTAAPESRHIQCLLELQVRHIRARFAVYLTENPGGSSREILESKGILVADINTFLGTVQKVAAPFRRSYW